jgi:hypothetical protein
MLPQLIGGGIGAVQGGMQGGLKGALLGGALGAAVPWGAGALGTRLAGTALGAKLGAGVAKGLTAGSGKLWGAASGLGREGLQGLGRTTAAQAAQMMNAGARTTLGPQGLGGLAATGYLGLGAPGIGSLTNTITGGAGGALGAGASQLAREGNLVPMSALPKGYQPDVNSMVRGPEGNWWYQMDPSGVAQGNRMGRLLDSQVNASNINTLGNAMFGQTERIGKAEFERQAAATQLASNIQQARQMALNSQEAGLRMGIDAGQNVAHAMQNRQNFRYF